MIKICRDIREVAKYKRLSFLQSGRNFIPILSIDFKLFIRARELFEAGHVLVEVKDNCGETIFFLKMCHDMIDTGVGNADVDLNFHGCDLSKEENLDSSLLKKAKCFLFEELEEYTFELTAYLIRNYPEVQIFYLDPNAKHFFCVGGGLKALQY